MSENSDQNRSRLPHELPEELIDAIECVRGQTASPELVAKVASKATKLNQLVNPSSRMVKESSAFALWATVVAAMLVVATSVGLLAYRSKENAGVPAHLNRDVAVRSTVTKSSLVLVGYRRVVEDLDRADAKAEQLSQSLELAAVRLEIQATLDEFCDWSEKE